MHCPLCKQILAEGEELQFHFLLGCPAYSAAGSSRDDDLDETTVRVRFRWAKVEPCVKRIVHLISSLAGSVAMHWSDLEGLYESSKTTVPIGRHSCQLAIGGDVVPVQDFDIDLSTDVMYIVPIEVVDDESDNRESIVNDDDDPVADLLASRSFQEQQYESDIRAHHHDNHSQDDNGVELSPLYKEMLQHQVLHGEPSWIPSSGTQSPTSSDQEIEELIERAKNEGPPPRLSGQPANPNDRLIRSPIPIKPHELPEPNLEKTENDKEENAENTVVERDESEPSASSADKENSEISVEANSDSSDESLKEQALDDSTPIGPPMVDELPCPYTGTFIPDNQASCSHSGSATINTPEDKTHQSGTGTQSCDHSGHSEITTSHLPSSDQSKTRASPQETQSDNIHGIHGKTNQSDARAILFDRPLSARSTLSERVSPNRAPPEMMQRRFSGPSGYPMLKERRTPPPTGFKSPHGSLEGRCADLPRVSPSEPSPRVMSKDRRTPPLTGFKSPHSTIEGRRDDLPSPSEPSPSVMSKDRRTPPHTGIKSPHNTIEGRRDDLPSPSEPSPSVRSKKTRTPPLTGFKSPHSTIDGRCDDLPSPSEPSPSISSRSSPRGYPQTKRILPDRPLSGAHSDVKRDQIAKSPENHPGNVPGSVQGIAGEESIPDDQTEHERLAEEWSKQTALYEEEIKQLKTMNEELCQQLLNLEAAAEITQQELKRSEGLDQVVQELNKKLVEKDEEVSQLKQRCSDLEKENQQMKDEQESLKTINKLTYDDLNKVNSDLIAERSEVTRRKVYGQPTRTLPDDDPIPQIEKTKRVLHDKVIRLETEKRDLKQKYNDTKQELERTKAEKSISEFRITKAKSEADLREKFDSFTDYKKTLDKGYGLSDRKIDTDYKKGLNSSLDHALLNGTTSRELDDYTRQKDPASYGSSRRYRSIVDDNNANDHPRCSHNRHRSLSSESSSSSSLLEYEYGANIHIPYDPTSYRSRDKRVEIREPGTRRTTRPHSYHSDTSKPTTDYLTDPYTSHKRTTSYATYKPFDYVKPQDHLRNSHNSTSDPSYGIRDYSRPFLPISTGEVRLGKRVVVMRSCGNVGRGVVRYVGHLPKRQGAYIGVELDKPDGKHDGCFNGEYFFKCKPNRGIFVKFDKVVMCYN